MQQRLDYVFFCLFSLPAHMVRLYYNTQVGNICFYSLKPSRGPGSQSASCSRTVSENRWINMCDRWEGVDVQAGMRDEFGDEDKR